ncbi:uncharacterized protein SPSK_05183 [Sporothrix schenckii 1099-18]|uniref:Uncharacterized protein n=2 Tax=Sporothrix schenckii TaxID=29908 RepID=U7Q425_SPOS1|nr:uncharacterized protein SPSK_05183 [Sporothrix schenckii 1099-18]ERT01785.1 hypothetical protein HMPREF1624_00079 [Sporothrix schenckii ATCC 58251]KJR81084.1 hypothetical protein SPSK_05183 [Sporothrix schenckii 1099-18]
MDTPAIPAPRDAQEREILANLESIRDRLLLLKQDRTKYIRSQDVLAVHNETIEQVRRLREVRAGRNDGENRLDRVLESCFQLLSLFFMTIGRTSEAPAAYALTSTIRRLLDHLTEANLYSAKDLESITHTLERLSSIVHNPDSNSSPYLTELMVHRVDQCKESIKNLQEKLEKLEKPLPAVHEKLISILRSMSLANTKARFPVHEVQKYKSQLKEIDEHRINGDYANDEGKVPSGIEEVSQLLSRCLLWADVVLERKGVIPDEFKPMYETLVGIRNELEKLSITQAWSLRETDLYDFQRQLDKFDEARVDGNWVDEEGKPAELYVQRTCLYLIRRSYGLVYSLMISSEPVSEALLPVYNQLLTLKRCLIEVKESGGVSSPRELYPYSMKLNSIDNMRVDGKFMVGGDIPEGQGNVTELLAECFELNYELRIAAEDKATEDND